MSKRFPFPVPIGWFHIAFEHEMEPGQVRALDVLGKELVLWRAEDGSWALQDRYCPHLGGNFAVGGEVVGASIQCPFHQWRFNTSGEVVDIPYAKTLNKHACVRSYPLVIKHGIVMGWYHPEGKSPSFELLEAPELDDPAWTRPITTRHEIKTCLQEMGENTADSAHFHTVHKHPGAATYDNYVADGPILEMNSRQLFPSSRGPVEGTLDSVTCGFGWSIVRYKTVIDICLLTSAIPIDEEHVVQYFHVSYKNPDDDEQVHRIGEAFNKEVNRQFTDDMFIWEHKAYVPNPKLCDGDGPIAKFRRWAKQFYVEDAA